MRVNFNVAKSIFAFFRQTIDFCAQSWYYLEATSLVLLVASKMEYANILLCSWRLQLRRSARGSAGKYADMAQEVEHILGKDEVTSSNLVISSNWRDGRAV